MIGAWHILIAGHGQREGQLNGTQRLWMKLGRLRAPDTVVILREWDSDWGRLAELIWLASQDGQPPCIRVYAYSWGAGYGFIQLAKQLQRRGLGIQSAVLCDPVYHSRLLTMRWLAIMPWCVIRVQPNVAEVFVVQQSFSLLRGHPVVAKNPSMTVIHPPVDTLADHYHLDESSEFQSLALKIAGIVA